MATPSVRRDLKALRSLINQADLSLALVPEHPSIASARESLNAALALSKDLANRFADPLKVGAAAMGAKGGSENKSVNACVVASSVWMIDAANAINIRRQTPNWKECTSYGTATNLTLVTDGLRAVENRPDRPILTQVPARHACDGSGDRGSPVVNR